jgi:hypothetical protein
MMKRLVLCAALWGGLGCGSCDSGLGGLDFQSSATTTIPGNPLSVPIQEIPFGGTWANFDINQSEQIQNQGVDKDDINSARLRSLRVNVVSGDSLESFLSSIAFYVQSDGLPEQRVAHREGIEQLPPDTRSIDCEIDDVELKPYITAPSMQIVTRATGQFPRNDTTLEAAMVLRLNISIL